MIPMTMTSSSAPTTGAMLCPSRAAMTAASAPSVARIGVTTPTLPNRKAEPARTSPATLPTPESTSQPVFCPTASGRPARATKGTVSSNPSPSAQATVEYAPMTFTARDDSSELPAKSRAVVRPNTMLITYRP
jgi:hypothetical protein